MKPSLEYYNNNRSKMTSHLREHPSWNENHASTIVVVIYYRFVEEAHRASTHHMLKQRVIRMVSGFIAMHAT